MKHILEFEELYEYLQVLNTPNQSAKLPGGETLGVGLTKRARKERKAGKEAYRKEMGYSNKTGVLGKDLWNSVRSHYGTKIPSLPGTKRRAAKHKAMVAYHKEKGKRYEKQNE